jgi:hypothetical protein
VLDADIHALNYEVGRTGTEDLKPLQDHGWSKDFVAGAIDVKSTITETADEVADRTCRAWWRRTSCARWSTAPGWSGPSCPWPQRLEPNAFARVVSTIPHIGSPRTLVRLSQTAAHHRCAASVVRPEGAPRRCERRARQRLLIADGVFVDLCDGCGWAVERTMVRPVA